MIRRRAHGSYPPEAARPTANIRARSSPTHLCGPVQPSSQRGTDRVPPGVPRTGACVSRVIAVCGGRRVCCTPVCDSLWARTWRAQHLDASIQSAPCVRIRAVRSCWAPATPVPKAGGPSWPWPSSCCSWAQPADVLCRTAKGLWALETLPTQPTHLPTLPIPGGKGSTVAVAGFGRRCIVHNIQNTSSQSRAGWWGRGGLTRRRRQQPREDTCGARGLGRSNKGRGDQTIGLSAARPFGLVKPPYHPMRRSLAASCEPKYGGGGGWGTGRHKLERGRACDGGAMQRARNVCVRSSSQGGPTRANQPAAKQPPSTRTKDNSWRRLVLGGGGRKAQTNKQCVQAMPAAALQAWAAPVARGCLAVCARAPSSTWAVSACSSGFGGQGDARNVQRACATVVGTAGGGLQAVRRRLLRAGGIVQGGEGLCKPRMGGYQRAGGGGQRRSPRRGAR